MVKIGNDVGNGFPRRNGKCSVGIVVWFPLVHMQFAFRKVKTLFKFHTYIIKTFKRTHAGGANRNRTCVVSKQLFQGLPLYAYILRVHLVAFNFFRLDRFESSCPDMKCELLTVDSMRVQFGEHIVCEMKSCRRGGNRAFDFGINGLVCSLVAFLCLSVQVWRNGQFARNIQYLRKRNIGIVPRKFHDIASTCILNSFGRKSQTVALHLESPVKTSLLPLLEIANHANP